MPMPRPLNALPRYLNPVLTPLARRLPPLAVLHHVGRRSGTAYDTPVQAFRTPQGFVVGLAYEPDAAWALNLLAAGDGQMTRAGRRYQLTPAAAQRPRGTATPAGLGLADDARPQRRGLPGVRRRTPAGLTPLPRGAGSLLG